MKIKTSILPQTLGGGLSETKDFSFMDKISQRVTQTKIRQLLPHFCTCQGAVLAWERLGGCEYLILIDTATETPSVVALEALQKLR